MGCPLNGGIGQINQSDWIGLDWIGSDGLLKEVTDGWSPLAGNGSRPGGAHGSHSCGQNNRWQPTFPIDSSRGFNMEARRRWIRGHCYIDRETESDGND